MNTLILALPSLALTIWLLLKARSEQLRNRVKHGFSITKVIENGEQITFTSNLYEGQTFSEMVDSLAPVYQLTQHRKDEFWKFAQEQMEKVEAEQKAAAEQKKLEQGSHLTPA